MTEAFALALLASVPGLGYVGRSRLLAAAGGALAAVQEPRAYARLLGERAYAALTQAIANADALAEALWRDQTQLVALGEPGYPPLLAQTARPPHVLFVKGRADLTDRFPFGVVGTRQADAYGLSSTRAIAKDLAAAGVCVVSGLALGVDAAAHEGALSAGGRTIAVLGGALDCFYPAANRPLARRILESGGSVVTEYPPGMRPTRYTFLERNRIIAGLSLGVLVTRGTLRSGAHRTAADALDEGREVFALPGDANNALSALPNRLIAEGARLTGCARDILDALVIEPASGAPAAPVAPAAPAAPVAPSAPVAPAAQAAPSAPTAQTAPAAPAAPALPEGLGETERAVLLALSRGEADFDALCEATGVPAQELGAALSMMELDGLIDARPGLRYARAQG